MNEQLVSIIVPSYNSESTIKKCIDSLLNIDYPNYEVIVVDDGSQDRTKEILLSYKSKIKLVEIRHSGPSKCRNIAIKEAKGEFVAFTDSDCIVYSNWLKELVKGFVQDSVVGVGGIQLSPKDETNFGKRVQDFFELTGFLGGYIKAAKNKELAEVSHNPSCNVMYRKVTLIEIGGFDEELWPSEDVDLDYRLKQKGHIFMFNPKAIVYHYRPQSLKALLRMMFRYGRVQGILTRRYGFFRKIQAIPLILILFLVSAFMERRFLLLALFFYSIVFLKKRNFVASIIIWFLSILSLLGWSVGFFIGLIK